MCDLGRPFCTSGGPFAHLSIASPMCDLGCPFRTSPNESGERPPFAPPPATARRWPPCRAAALPGRSFIPRACRRARGDAPMCRMPFSPAPRAPLSLRTSATPCAEGTSQIAHRNSEPALKDFFYVRFGTSLLHIRHPSPMCNLGHPFCTCLRVRGRSGPAGLRQACVGDDGAFFRVLASVGNKGAGGSRAGRSAAQAVRARMRPQGRSISGVSLIFAERTG